MKSQTIDRTLMIVLVVIAITFSAMLVSAALDVSTNLVAGLFYRSFSYASFYLPAYLGVSAYLVAQRKATKSNIIILNLTFIPFVTCALLLKTFLGRLDEMSYVERELMAFFNNGAPVVLGALLALELLILLRIAALLTQKVEDNHGGSSLLFGENELATKPTDPVIEVEPLTKEHEMPEDNEKKPEQSLPTARESLEHLAQGNEDFSFLDAFHDNSDLLRMNGDKEFLHELDKIEKSSNLLLKPNIDIEGDFKKQKKNFNDHSFLLEEDLGVSFLSQTSDNLPPHLRHNLLSPAEEEALNQAATEIAENSEEESHIASLIDGANRSLDEALSSNEMIRTKKPIIESSSDGRTEKKNEQAIKGLSTDGSAKEPMRALDAFEREATTFDIVPYLPAPFNESPTDVISNDELNAMAASFADESIEEEESPFESLEEESSSSYHVPIENILDSYGSNAYWEIDDATTKAAYALESTLKEFNIEAKVIAIRKGPVVTMFELLPAAGVKLSKIENLSDNIAFRLAASRVRIVAPIPGKQAVGIEIPNQIRSIVSFSELIASELMHDPMNYIPLALGKDIEGQNQVIDLSKTPHLLIAGSTGSGKSVCVNSIICSILYTRKPRDVRLILIDPKVVELKPYNDIPHLLAPVITEPKKALQAVQWSMYEMERRYNLLDGMGVKNIRSYNKKIKEKAIAALPLPYIVLIIDEFADLIASCGKELEISLARLAAKSRASGIHLILATQRPSADVITGLIKANFPSRIAFMVASKVDSRIILDMGGAEQLLGKGDMLFTSSWNPFATRMQSAFLSEDEVDRVTTYVKTLGEPDYIDDEMFYDEESIAGDDVMPDDDDDPLFDKALEIVIEQRKASASYLQRRLKIGYNRAARLVELMEERAIVGPANGSKPRDLLRIPT